MIIRDAAESERLIKIEIEKEAATKDELKSFVVERDVYRLGHDTHLLLQLVSTATRLCHVFSLPKSLLHVVKPCCTVIMQLISSSLAVHVQADCTNVDQLIVRMLTR